MQQKGFDLSMISQGADVQGTIVQCLLSLNTALVGTSFVGQLLFRFPISRPSNLVRIYSHTMLRDGTPVYQEPTGAFEFKLAANPQVFLPALQIVDATSYSNGDTTLFQGIWYKPTMARPMDIRPGMPVLPGVTYAMNTEFGWTGAMTTAEFNFMLWVDSAGLVDRRAM